MELKNQVESILFSAGKRVHIDDIVKVCRANQDDVIAALNELKDEYDTKNASLMVMQEGLYWKLTVREMYQKVVRKVVTTSELSKTLMETLAVIAWKAPVKQSDVIKIRTNKAYDHLSELEDSGYIIREKFGRTKLIRLAKKFFEYFDIPEEKLKEKFHRVDELAKAIENKEFEIEAIKRDQEERAKREKTEIDLFDEKGHKIALKKYNLSSEQKEKALKEEPKIEEDKVRIGELEVVDEEPSRQEEPKKSQGLDDSKQDTDSEPEEDNDIEEEPADDSDSSNDNETQSEEESEEGTEEQEIKPEEEQTAEEDPDETDTKQNQDESDEKSDNSNDNSDSEPEEDKEENDDVKEALEGIEKEKREEPAEEEEEKDAEEDLDLDKRAEKRANEILSPNDDKMSPEVEAELNSMLGKKTEISGREQRSDGIHIPSDKPDFADEVSDMVENAGEDKLSLPAHEQGKGPKDLVEARKKKEKK